MLDACAAARKELRDMHETIKAERTSSYAVLPYFLAAHGFGFIQHTRYNASAFQLKLDNCA